MLNYTFVRAVEFCLVGSEKQTTFMNQLEYIIEIQHSIILLVINTQNMLNRST